LQRTRADLEKSHVMVELCPSTSPTIAGGRAV
jgi:hypothetical protein